MRTILIDHPFFFMTELKSWSIPTYLSVSRTDDRIQFLKFDFSPEEHWYCFLNLTEKYLRIFLRETLRLSPLYSLQSTLAQDNIRTYSNDCKVFQAYLKDSKSWRLCWVKWFKKFVELKSLLWSNFLIFSLCLNF